MNSRKGKSTLKTCAVITNIFFFCMICSQSYAQQPLRADEVHPGIARSVRMNDPQIRADNDECKGMSLREGELVQLASGNFCAMDGFGKKSVVVHRSKIELDVPAGSSAGVNYVTHVWVEKGEPPPPPPDNDWAWWLFGSLLGAAAICTTMGVLAHYGYFDSGTPDEKNMNMSRQGLTVPSF